MNPLRFFEHVLHGAGVSIIATSPDGLVTFFNRTAEEWLGWSATEVVGLRTPEAFHDAAEVAARAAALTRELGREVAPGFEAFVAKARSTRSADTNEWTYRRRDGSRFRALLSVTPLFEDDGAPFGYLGVAHDITARDQAERALREREAVLESLFASAPIAIGLMGPDRTFRKTNRFLEVLVGLRSEDLLGKSPRLCYDTDEEYARVGQMLYGALGKGPGTALAEFRVKHSAGHYRDVVGTLSYLDPSTPEAGLVSTLLDVTELKRVQREHGLLEQQLLQAQKLESVGRLAGGIAHDLNNMLMPIMAYAQQLQEELPPQGEHQEMAAEVLRAARRSKDMVEQLLAFARKRPMKLEQVDLLALVTGFARVLRHTLPENLAVEVTGAEGLPGVRADPVQLEQVILNLAINASDAMPSGGKLTLALSAREAAGGAGPGEVVLVVQDTGSGMSEEVRRQAFEPFFTTKESGKGTGLGLSMVYGIVQQHGGRITLSSAPGEGARFEIALPASASPAQAPRPPPPAEEQPPRGGETVLLVEDQAPVLDLVTRLLARLGYRVLAASDAAAALALAQSHDGPIALLLTDVLLPGLNGKELFARLSALRPDLRAVFMSGYAADALPPGGAEDTVLLSKPFALPELARALRGALERRA